MPARKRAQEAKRRAREVVAKPPALSAERRRANLLAGIGDLDATVEEEIDAAWFEHEPCEGGRHCPCGLGYCCYCGPYHVDTSAEEIAEFRSDPASRP